jgi:hypothetical protein
MLCCRLRSIQSGVGLYECVWLLSNDARSIEPWASNLLMAKVAHTLLWAGSLVARGEMTSSVRNQLNYIG